MRVNHSLTLSTRARQDGAQFANKTWGANQRDLDGFLPQGYWFSFPKLYKPQLQCSVATRPGFNIKFEFEVSQVTTVSKDQHVWVQIIFLQD